MSESATIPHGIGLRERKRAATRASITKTARQMTVKHGLHGFTVDQLCEEVGVSRRTLFNYFPSKEDAIIGYLLDEFPPEAVEAFVLAGCRMNPHGSSRCAIAGEQLTETLLRDLAELTASMADQLNITAEHIQELLQVVKVEPQLMMKLMGSADDREREFAGLIAKRESLPPDDPLPLLIAGVFGAMSRQATQSLFSEGNTISYREHLRHNITMAKAFFALSAPIIEGPS